MNNTEMYSTDWEKIHAEEAEYDRAHNEELREYYQGIVDDIDAHGGPRVWDLPGPASMWRGDGKCHTEEMRYNDAKQWLAAHPV